MKMSHQLEVGPKTSMKYKLCWPVNYFVTVPTKFWRPPPLFFRNFIACCFITRMQCTMHGITWCNIMLCVQKWTMGGNCVKLWCSNCLREWIFTPWPWFYAPVCFNINERIDHWINTSWDRGLWLNGLLCHMIPSISALIPNMSPGLGVKIKSYGLSGLRCTIFSVTLMEFTEWVSGC